MRAFELYDPDLTDFREPVDKTLGLFYTETRAKELEELAEKRKELNITRKTMKTLQYFNLPPLVDFEAVFIADEARTAGQVIPTFAYRDAKGLRYLGISSWNSPQLIQRAGDLVEARKNVAGATGSLSMVDHRCSRNLDLYKVKKGVFEPVGEP